MEITNQNYSLIIEIKNALGHEGTNNYLGYVH